VQYTCCGILFLPVYAVVFFDSFFTADVNGEVQKVGLVLCSFCEVRWSQNGALKGGEKDVENKVDNELEMGSEF
jgi:hypothetical protein